MAHHLTCVSEGGKEQSCRSTSVRSLLRFVIVHLVAAYVVWVLLGTVAFVNHLGKQAPSLAKWLPSGDQQGKSEAPDMWSFLKSNVPIALVFILPHSMIRPKRLTSALGRNFAYSRLIYNTMAAVSLQFFMRMSVALETPVVFENPLPRDFQLVLAAGCLALAAVCFLLNEGTPTLLGVSQLVPCYQVVSLPPGMDAITWMGLCVWRRCGSFAFVIFTGVSILPPQLSLGDAVIRGSAALYLRARSMSFQRWLVNVDAQHNLTWIIRGGLLLLALRQMPGSSWSDMLWNWRLAAAAGLAGILRVAEMIGRRYLK